MKKVMFATLLGGFLGMFDGLTSLFTPEVRDQIVGIVIGSTVKGLVDRRDCRRTSRRRCIRWRWVPIFGLAGRRLLRVSDPAREPGPHAEHHAPRQPGRADCGYTAQTHQDLES